MLWACGLTGDVVIEASTALVRRAASVVAGAVGGTEVPVEAVDQQDVAVVAVL